MCIGLGYKIGLSVLLVSIGSLAFAASLKLYPIYLHLQPGKPTIVNATNVSRHKIAYYMKVVKWQQQGARDLYTKSKTILANPLVFSLQPKQEQVVRLMFMGKLRQIEQTYRLFFQQIPIKTRSKTKHSQITVLLNIGIPVFVKPDGPVVHKLVWRLKRLANNRLHLTLVNRGNVHAKILNFSLMLPNRARILFHSSRWFYLLAANQRHWIVRLAKSVKVKYLKVAVTTDRGKNLFQVPVR